MMKSKLNPTEDGITHINIYSKAETQLGIFLSNFAKCNIQTEDGPFKSIEGYWYWLSCKDDNLRQMYGWQAKSYGREFGGTDWMDGEDFKRKICDAIEYKIRNSDEFYMEFVESDLPFRHYYVYNGKVIEPKEGRWVIEFIEQLRKQCNS